jgi:hypothetical protein
VEQDRAFRKSLVTGSLITLGVWGTLILFVLPDSDLIWGFAAFALVTLLFVIPVVYRVYRQEEKPKPQLNPTARLLWACLYFLSAVAYGINTYMEFRRYGGRHLLLSVVVCASWLLLGVFQIFRTVNLRKS